jgi:cytochrome P450
MGVANSLGKLRVGIDAGVSVAELALWWAHERISTPIVFNPFAKRLHEDPFSLYRELRERDPIHRSAIADGWVLTRYDDILEVLRDPSFSSDERHWSRYARYRARGERRGLPDPYGPERTTMLRIDPPDHARLRGLANKAFTPRAVERIRPRAEALVDELLGALASRTRLELVADFASPLPVIIIAEMLGVPAEDHERFRHWSDEAIKTLGNASAQDILDAEVAFGALRDYLAAVVEARRAEPREDLISALVAAEEEGDQLSLAELISMCVLLLVAGNETTTKLIGNAVVALARNPEQLALLRDEPKRIEGAVDEFLRYDGPVQLTSRIVLEDRDFHGRRFRRGEQVVTILAAGNRDPAVFEDPDRLDVTRENVRHLAFGQGLHFCLGSQLARLEAGLAIEGLLRHFPSFRLAPEPVVWSTNTILRGPTTLPLVV